MLNKKISINVINAETLKPMLNEVTSLIAGVVKNTFGPFGHSTLVQTLDSVYSTKDGWNVVRNLNISVDDGEFSPAINSMKKLIVDTAQSVVLNAGDGTTTVILAANELNKIVSDFALKNGLDSRAIENFLNRCVKMINDELSKSAIKITENNTSDIIRRIALISTNWDEEVADLIQEIYITTKNPIIKIEDSGNQKTYVEYTYGYDLKAELQLANHYLNNEEKGSFEADNPIVLVFAAPLGKKHTKPLATLGQIVKQPLVVMAPGFDIDFLQVIENMNIEFKEAGISRVNIIPCKFAARSDIDKDCVGDLAALLGTTVLSTQYDRLYNTLNALDDTLAEKQEYKKEKATKPQPKVSAGTDPKESKLDNDQKAYIATAAQELSALAGRCGHISITSKEVVVSDFSHNNIEEFNRRKSNLKNALKQKYEQYNAESSMTESVRLMRIRLGKMECQMGTIKVGGSGAAHIKARKDAIEDATRACEVAYTGGYVLDGGLAIARAAQTCTLKQKPKEDNDIDVYLEMFVNAFINTCKIMYNNRYNDDHKSSMIVNKCLEEDVVYNLVTERYSTDELITPVEVCKDVVAACLRLVLVNCTSNQFVYQSTKDLIRSMEEASEIADHINAQKAEEESEEMDD